MSSHSQYKQMIYSDFDVNHLVQIIRLKQLSTNGFYIGKATVTHSATPSGPDQAKNHQLSETWNTYLAFVTTVIWSRSNYHIVRIDWHPYKTLSTTVHTGWLYTNILLLHRLHWLRAPERMSYKLAVLVFQCTHGLGPVYLTDTLQPVAGIPGRQRLRSSSTSALVVPPTRLATVGDRSFPVVAARIWNNLPIQYNTIQYNIRLIRLDKTQTIQYMVIKISPAEVTSSTSLPTFKSKLKSHLFSASFP